MAEAPNELVELGLDKNYFCRLISKIKPESKFNPKRTAFYVHPIDNPYANIESRLWSVELGDLDTSNFLLKAHVKQYGVRERPDLYDLPSSLPKDHPIDTDIKNINFLKFFGGINIYDHLLDKHIVVMEHCEDNLEDIFIKKVKKYVTAIDQTDKEHIRGQVVQELIEAGKRVKEYSSKATKALETMISQELRDEPFYDAASGNSRLTEYTEEALVRRFKEYLNAIFDDIYLTRIGRIGDYRFTRQKLRWSEDYVRPAMREIKGSNGIARKLLEDRDWVHFDLRPQHVLKRGPGIEFCDFEKSGFGIWSIDPAFLFFSPLVDYLEISATERVRMLRKDLGATKNQARHSSIWALFRHAGSLALLAQVSPQSTEKYTTLLKKSNLYDKSVVIPKALSNLDVITRDLRNFANINRAVRYLLDLPELYGRTPEELLPQPQLSEQRLNLTVDDLPVAALLVDPGDKTVIYGNDKAVELLKFSDRNTLSSRFFAELYRDTEKFKQDFKAILESKYLTKREELKTDNGHFISVYLKARLIDNDKKHIIVVMDQQEEAGLAKILREE